MSIMKSMYEDLKTRKKYNTLLLKYEMLEASYEKKVIEYDQLKRKLITARAVWEEQLRKQEEEIIKLKKKKANKK